MECEDDFFNLEFDLEAMYNEEGFSCEFSEEKGTVVFRVESPDSDIYEEGIIETSLEEFANSIIPSELDYLTILWKEAIEEQFPCLKDKLKYEIKQRNDDWYLKVYSDAEESVELPVIERFFIKEDNGTKRPAIRIILHFINYDKFLNRLKEKFGEKYKAFEE